MVNLAGIIIVIIILILGLVIVTVPIRLFLDFRIGDDLKPSMHLRVRAVGILWAEYTRSMDELSLQEDNEETPTTTGKRPGNSVADWVQSSLRPSSSGFGIPFLSRPPPHYLRHIERLSWTTVIGTGDAALTGGLVGIVWGIKAALIGRVMHYVRFSHQPTVLVRPDFDQARLELDLNCIFRFTIGHIILAALPWQLRS